MADRENTPPYDWDLLKKLAVISLEAQGKPVSALAMFQEMAKQRRVQLQAWREGNK